MKLNNLKAWLLAAAVVAIITDLTRLYLNIRELKKVK